MTKPKKVKAKAKAKPKKLGRPLKYVPSMLPKIMPLMSKGASLYEVAAELRISFDTLNEWRKPGGPQYNKAFSETVKEGLNLSRAWWEREGRENTKNSQFQAALWFMNVKNRFNSNTGEFRWADKQETEHSGGIEVKTFEVGFKKKEE